MIFNAPIVARNGERNMLPNGVTQAQWESALSILPDGA
jgi:hypothetical protein